MATVAFSAVDPWHRDTQRLGQWVVAERYDDGRHVAWHLGFAGRDCRWPRFGHRHPRKRRIKVEPGTRWLPPLLAACGLDRLEDDGCSVESRYPMAWASRPSGTAQYRWWTRPLAVTPVPKGKEVGGPEHRQLEPPEGVTRPARRDKAGPPRQARVELTPQQEALPANYVLHV